MCRGCWPEEEGSLHARRPGRDIGYSRILCKGTAARDRQLRNVPILHSGASAKIVDAASMGFDDCYIGVT